MLRIEGPAAVTVRDGGGRVVCGRLPCRWVFSRQTCFGYDSSSGFIALTAEASDGRRLRAPLLTTCDVVDGTLVRFELPPPATGACAVVVDDGEPRRFETACESP